MKAQEKRERISPPGCGAGERASCVFDTPVGWLRLVEDQAGICAVQFADGEDGPAEAGEKGRFLDRAKGQLLEYFAGERRSFDLPLSTHGTPFQEKVWRALRDIPWGETRSYRQVAEMIGSPKAARAVGMANNRNPLPILIPCHRVVGKDGTLVGYAGGLERKRTLLSLEAPKISPRLLFAAEEI